MNNSSYLDELEARSIYIIREAYWRFREKLGFLWSMGKDSTALVHLGRKAFLGKIPVKLLHIDTSFKFREIYEFRDKLTRDWGLDLLVVKNDLALAESMSTKQGRFECCNALKTEALKQAIEKYGFKALLVGIRRDEHSIRAKERYFSSRGRDFKWDYQNQPMELWSEYFKTELSAARHSRVHPLLHWHEIDIWRYIERERLPVVSLYFAKGGKRYRSIGCECCCEPISSAANTVRKIIREIEGSDVSERSGRKQDKEKEYMMQKLRSLGYM